MKEVVGRYIVVDNFVRIQLKTTYLHPLSANLTFTLKPFLPTVTAGTWWLSLTAASSICEPQLFFYPLNNYMDFYMTT